MSAMAAWIDALRIRQWHKNLLVLVPLVFAFRLPDPESVRRSVLLCAAFCLASSGIYLVNDLMDRDLDRGHPLKKRRAIAAGNIDPGAAGAMALILLVTGPAISAFFVSLAATRIMLCYFVVQLIYNFLCRGVAAADVVTIALGFVLRAVAGAVAIGVPFSEWLILCTFFGAVRLAIGKRQAEVHAGRTGLRRGWGSLGWEAVSETEITIIGAMTSSVLLVAYAFYCFTSRTAGLVMSGGSLGIPPLLLSLPVVFFGVVRYELVASAGRAGDPELLPFQDKPLSIALLGWLAVSFAALYLWRSV